MPSCTHPASTAGIAVVAEACSHTANANVAVFSNDPKSYIIGTNLFAELGDLLCDKLPRDGNIEARDPEVNLSASDPHAGLLGADLPQCSATASAFGGRVLPEDLQ